MICTPGIEINTGSSQCIILPKVFFYTLGKLQLHQVIADLSKIWKMRDHRNTQAQLSVGPPLGRTYAAPAVCWGGGRNPPPPCLDLGR